MATWYVAFRNAEKTEVPNVENWKFSAGLLILTDSQDKVLLVAPEATINYAKAQTSPPG